MQISSQVSDMSPHYHDTLMLLKKYRDIAWTVEVSNRNLQEEFRAEYGCPGRDVLNSLKLNKADTYLMLWVFGLLPPVGLPVVFPVPLPRVV